jgi:hypothetical protein
MSNFSALMMSSDTHSGKPGVASNWALCAVKSMPKFYHFQIVNSLVLALTS